MTIEVSDHGPGMTAEQIESAFAPFQRFEDRGWAAGAGLGLAICKGFCEAIGADLQLLATDGGGLTARIRLGTAA